jgi:general nucleoside transport system ATP-binding protein
MTLAAELRGIDKSFFGRKVVEGVDLDIRAGEIHGLLGENGAGKTSLCSVLAGLYRADAGDVIVDGSRRVFQSPRDALTAGIGMVYQHFRLVRTLTVAENFVLAQGMGSQVLSRPLIEQRVAELAERYSIAVRPSARVRDLSIGEQQRVEILKLLYLDVRILILDEPTTVLTPQEAAGLFETVRLLSEEGRAIVLVSHKLEDVRRTCSRITILRDGRRVAQLASSEAESKDLARLMVGRELELPARGDASTPGEPALEIDGLRVLGELGHEAVRGVDLAVRAGEVLGIAGVAGNGQRELADAVAGLRSVQGGTVRVGHDRRDITAASVRDRIAAGISYVPEDRLRVALAAGLPAWVNLSFKRYRDASFGRGFLLSKRLLKRMAGSLVRRFDVRGVSEDRPVRLLSGGNLQRLILAREIADRPTVLIAASPTHGLDVAAIANVHELVLQQRQLGTAILLLSEDLDELFALADRIAVMFEGRIVGELPTKDATPALIGLMMAGRQPGGDGDGSPSGTAPVSPAPQWNEPS